MKERPEKSSEPERDRRRTLARVAAGLVLLAVFSAVAVLWQVTPLRDWLDLARLLDRLRAFGHSPMAVTVVLAAYPISGLLMVPTTLLILASVAVFGPWWGFAYAGLGCLLSATVFYGLGRALQRWRLRILRSRRIDRVSALLTGHEVFAVAAVNLSQLVSFMLIGLAAGVLRMNFGRYVVGTLIGIVPGIIVLTLFEDRFDKAVHQPTTENIAALSAVAVFWLFAVFWCARRLVRHLDKRDGPDGPKPPNGP